LDKVHLIILLFRCVKSFLVTVGAILLVNYIEVLAFIVKIRKQ